MDFTPIGLQWLQEKTWGKVEMNQLHLTTSLMPGGISGSVRTVLWSHVRGRGNIIPNTMPHTASVFLVDIWCVMGYVPHCSPLTPGFSVGQECILVLFSILMGLDPEVGRKTDGALAPICSLSLTTDAARGGYCYQEQLFNSVKRIRWGQDLSFKLNNVGNILLLYL